MRLSTDVVYDMLSEKYTLRRYGLKARKRELLLPVFYNPRTQTRKGAIYVARTEDLVRKPMEDCLFFCVGPKPPTMWDLWPCEIIHVQEAQGDLFAVFNALQRIFGRLTDWQTQMLELSSTGADVRSLVEASIPLFDNRITVTDFDLNILAYCEYIEQGGAGRIVMNNQYARVPLEKASEQGGLMRRAMRNREPFYVSEEGRPSSYCINLFVGDDYVGCCALQQEIRPLRAGDLELFAEFAGYVRTTLASQVHAPGGQLVTMRSVFEQLLRRYPVSRYDADRALELMSFNLQNTPLDECRWRCLVLVSANHERVYPERYLCATVEDMVEHSFAFAADNAMVVFCLNMPGESSDERFDVLDEYLADMNFLVGASRTFRNVFSAYEYYQQALAALETGRRVAPERRRHMFSDCALAFVLERCCGDLDPALVVDPCLAALAHSSSGGVDYVGTLRAYLDHNCNASRTAQAMFLHRSTLVQRLEHIERYVDLDSPDQRLFLRICLHLPGIDELLA